jgi:23S rRNA pseudouridine2605 synthase
MKHSTFKKFASPKKKNSVIKEEIRQKKKKAKKERSVAIDKHYEQKRRLREAEREAALNAPVSANISTVKTDKVKTIEASFKQTDKLKTIVREFAPPTAATIKPGKPAPVSNELMPLNKFVAHCGVCSRRDAVTVIKAGKVKVNNAVILEPAFKVSEKDDISFNGKKLFVSKNLVYILLNKPKDYITTTDDPQGRKTVLQLIKAATTERVYPVGRLDRNTSGVLLLTNDGELTQKLSHPSYNITKVYEAKLDKVLTKTDFDKILNGIQLEDGEIKADSLAYADAKDKSVIGIEIHSGRNRIVRRIFESMGYDVKGLDRVMYATLTKKNVERGKWRFLSEKEVRLLKYLNASFKKTPSKEKAETVKK